jgi:hypothetical protein
VQTGFVEAAFLWRNINELPQDTAAGRDREQRPLQHGWQGSSPPPSSGGCHDQSDCRPKLARGEIALTGMGLKLAAQLCGASLGYVETLSRLSPDDLARVPAHPWMLAQLHQRGREMSDADIDKLVAHVGAGRLMEALDRATAPAPVASVTE